MQPGRRHRARRWNPPDDGIVDIPTPAIALENTVDPTTAAGVVDIITYSFHVTNTGEVALTSVGVTETAFSGTGTLGAITCGPTAIPNGSVTLAVAAEIDCSATYALTLDDVVAGQVTNTAMSTGHRRQVRPWSHPRTTGSW